MKKILLIFLILSGISYGQDFLIDGVAGVQNITTCGGDFYDTGGDGGPLDVVNYYPDIQNDTVTFCPDVSGKKLRFIAEHFVLEIGDELSVYDGSSITASNLIGIYGQDGLGMQLNAGDTIQPSTSNEGGCLTFVFRSNGDSKTNRGFKFVISCFVPCQDIIGVGTFNGINAEDSIFHLCRTDCLDLAGFGIYPEMGTSTELYTQNNQLSSFNWLIFGPAGQQTSTSESGVFNPATGFSEAQHCFADSGIYHLILEIKDTLSEFECKNRNYVHNIVYVSGPPVFISDENPNDSTKAEIPIICLGDTDFLVGIVDTVFHIDDCEPASSPMKLIPDGQEEGGLRTIEMEAEYKCYGTQVIDDPSDILSICMDIEHSAIGDLEIKLTCPSGQTVTFLHQDLLANANLGVNNIIGGTTMGTIDTYCFNENSAINSLNFVSEATDADPSTYLNTATYIAGGSYLPIDAFSNLVGCRINGKWILSVKDSRINDNGYVGNWKLSFNPAIQPSSDSVFYNVYVDSNWIEDPTNPTLGINLTPLTTGDSLQVLPLAIGTYSYKFQVTDDFGCIYDTTAQFQVIDRKQADFTYFGDTVFCEGESGSLTPTFLPGFNNIMGESGVWTVSPGTGGLSVGPTGVVTIGASTVAGNYTITNTVTTLPGGCVDEHVFSSTIVIHPRPIPTISGAGNYCTTDTLTVDDPTLTSAPYEIYSWSNGDSNDTLFATDANNPITVTVTDTNGCVGTSQPVSVTALAQVQHIQTITICEGASATIHGILETVPGVYSQLFSTGQTSCDSVSTVTLAFFPRVNIGPDVTICEGDNTVLTASLPDLTNSNFTWSNGVFGQTQTVNPIINTTYNVTATDGNGCITRDTVTVIVSPVRDINLLYDVNTICVSGASPIPTFNAQAGYTFSSVPSGFVDPNTGLLTNTTIAGVYEITYTDNIFPCNINNTATITITASPDATFSFGTICVPGTTACPTFAVNASAGVFTLDPATNSGIVMNPSTGCLDLTATSAGLYIITNTIPASGVCPADSHTESITINDKPVVSGTAAPMTPNACVGGTTTLTGSSSSPNMSYSWSDGRTDGVAFAPQSSLTYTVTGTDQNGCSNTAIVSVIVNQLPVIDPLVGDVLCLGESATITATSPNSLSELITFAWTANPLPNPGSGSTHVVTPVSTTTYEVTATNNTTGCQNTANVTITVNQPIITAGADMAICVGQSATLCANGANTYTWAPATGLNTTAGQCVTSNAVATQTYSVTGTDVNGCTFEDFMTLTVNQLPNITATANPTTVCSGSPTTITGFGGVSYTTNPLSNPSPFANSATITASGSGVQNIVVTGTDANNCSNIFTVPITVNALPVIVGGADQVVCEGENVTLFATSTTTNNITWNPNPPTANGVSFVASATDTYTASGTDANGCVGTDQVTVVVNPLPTIVANASDQTLCEGDPLTLTGSGAGANGVYLWNNGVVDGTSFNVSGVTSTYVVTGIDGNGCQDVAQVVVTVNPNPQVQVTVSDNEICEGNSVNVSATVDPDFTYQWNPSGSGDSFSDTPPVGNNVYTVVVTDQNGCTGTNFSSAVLVINNNVIASFVPDSIQGYPGLTVDFLNNSSNATNYVWNFGNGSGDISTDSPGAQSSLYSNVGEYPVMLTATNSNTGCVDDTTIIITVVPFDGAIVCPPNIFTPDEDGMNDVFYVGICYGLVEDMSVFVFNRWGNQIHEMKGFYDPTKATKDNDPNSYWDGTKDGKPVTEGVYFYTYEIKSKDGAVVKGHDNIHIVRSKK